MNNWKQFVTTSLACGALLSFGAGHALADYSLNPEVKTATPALKMAAQIGILKSENPELRKLANKDAIVVMSFGTTFKESREKNIEATVKAIQAAHPGVKVVTAFTSHIIIDRIQKNEGMKVPTPEEALADLKKEGYTRIALCSLDVIPGMEYAYDLGVFQLHRNDFKKMTLGTPLMYWQGQEDQADDVTEVMKAFATQFPKPKMQKNEGVFLMAHGTPHPANAYYAVMQDRLEELGWHNVFIYSVEGWPSLEDVIKKARARGIKTVTLMPFMMVAGDHATNDMAGDEDDSHKNILKKNGFTVHTYMHGLGENKAVRELFVKRANDAWDALEAEQ